MKNRQRFLVVGADGLIGRALLQRFASQHQDAIGTTRRMGQRSSDHVLLDLDHDLAAWRPPEDCSVAFLCAAIPNQEKCRQEPDSTRRLNVAKTVELANILLDAGLFVVFLSTNLVFDGNTPAPKAEAATNPQTEYGRQKVLAEQALLGLGNNVAVVRLSKVFHGEMLLLKKWITALQKGETIFPLSDLLCSPVSLDFVTNVLDRVCAERMPGIFQVSGERDASYAEIALRLTHHLHVDERLVQPSSSSELGLHLEHLPRNTTMDASRLVKKLGLTPPSLDETLESVFEDALKYR